jgi:hypothetical protein
MGRRRYKELVLVCLIEGVIDGTFTVHISNKLVNLWRENQAATAHLEAKQVARSKVAVPQAFQSGFESFAPSPQYKAKASG